MGKPVFFESVATPISATINHGGALSTGSSADNMLNTLSRSTKINMTSYGLRICFSFDDFVYIDSVVIPRCKTSSAEMSWRAFGYTSNNGTGSAVFGTPGVERFNRFNTEGSEWSSCWSRLSSLKRVHSVILYVYGRSGYKLEINNILFGAAMELQRCPQEPTIQAVTSGEMVQTVSGLSVPRKPRRSSRTISIPLSSMTEYDRVAMFDFEQRNTNKPFYASLFPDETDWRGKQYSMLARFKGGLSYRRRGRTANHRASAVLVES